MTATQWLIAGPVALVLLGGLVVLIVRFIQNHWDAADALLQARATPPFRTADAEALARDVRKLQRYANGTLRAGSNPPPTYAKPPAPPAPPKVKL